jgi:hypothetical protein
VGINFLNLGDEWHMVFVSSSVAGMMEASDRGYSIYGTMVGANIAFTGVSIKEWITISDVVGKAHPNQPGNIGTAVLKSGLQSTTVLLTYTAA